jgi:hypothetical protein
VDDFRKRLLLNSGIIAGSFLAFWIAAHFLMGHIVALSEIIVAQRELAAERSYALDNLSTLKKQAPVAEKIQKSLDGLLPHEDGLLSFPEYMESVARVHALDFSFAFNGQPVAGQPGYVVFNAGATGSAKNIEDFLADLEFKSTRFLVTIDTMNMSAQGAAYHIDIAGKVYFQ